MKKFLAILFITQLAWSFTCPNIRLDKDFPGGKPVNKAKMKTMRAIPVKNQKLGICYSYSAVQMIDAVRSKRMMERGVIPRSSSLDESSPIFTAVTTESAWGDEDLYYKKNGDPHYPFEGGDLCSAFNSTKELGSCPRSKMEKLIQNSGLNEETFFQKLLSIEEDLKDKQADLYLNYKNEQSRIFSTSEDSDTVYDQTFGVRLQQSFQSTSDFLRDSKTCTNNAIDDMYADLKEIFKENLKVTKAVFTTYFNPELFNEPLQLGVIMKMVCSEEDRIKVNTNSTCKTYSVTDALDTGKKYPFTQKILEQLKQDSLPVGISYCGYMLMGDDNFDGIASKKPLKFQKSQGRDCGNHASLVIGSRWNPKKNTCEMLVRNTWGTKCTKKNYPSRSTLKKKSGTDTVDPMDVKCEGGNYWVDYKTLERNTYRAQHL